MKWRFSILIFFLLFRFSLGWWETSKYVQGSKISIAGNIINLYHNDTECIMVMGRFWIDFRDGCMFSRNSQISLIGRVNGGVIDRFLGRLWLDSAEIVEINSDPDVVSVDGELIGIISRFRENIVDVYRRYLPEPESGLVAGIVLGYKKDIGSDFYDQMVKSGTIHIAVASGYNIMLVGGTVLSVCFWFLKRKLAVVVAILAMLFYVVEAGGEPPVVRAVIMGSVVFVSTVLGRRVISWWILLVAGWLMILVDPTIVLSVSFQLSMSASVGLMVVEPFVRKKLRNRHENMSEVLGGSGILTSLSTMILTAPIIWWHFGRMSWIGIVSNIMILPLVPILMITGAMMQVIPSVFSWPTYVVAHWMVGVIRFFGS